MEDEGEAMGPQSKSTGAAALPSELPSEVPPEAPPEAPSQPPRDLETGVDDIDIPILCGIYNRKMLQKGHGLPCWDPSLPSSFRGQRTDIVPGDVGTIDVDGAFSKLFNLLEEDNATRRSLSPLPSSRQTTSNFNGARVITSDGIQCAPDFHDWPRIVYNFDCEAQSGAILVISSAAQVVTLDDTKALEEHAASNAKTLFRRAATSDTVPMGRDLSLVIVTGTIKTNAWAIAAYQQREQRSLTHNTTRLVLREDGYMRESEAPFYRWVESGGTYVSSGRSDSEKGVKDQTVFLQGFKMEFSPCDEEGMLAEGRQQAQDALSADGLHVKDIARQSDPMASATLKLAELRIAEARRRRDNPVGSVVRRW
ncbi:hypothetical protein NMY22_g5287 [Coprinellus aureogranulatus]|nr:hypothetical protein NMY22_g5287 [Coprinellus aureogranulatus]